MNLCVYRFTCEACRYPHLRVDDEFCAGCGAKQPTRCNWCGEPEGEECADDCPLRDDVRWAPV